MGYNIVGVALSTFIVYTIGKTFLVGYLWIKMKIKPSEYIPLRIYALYSVLIGVLFVLIDHRILIYINSSDRLRLQKGNF